MLNKIYLVLLAVAVLVMAFFTYYSWSWLQSIGSPKSVVENYEFHAGISWMFLWISAPALLIVGTAILWTYRRAWAMWLSCVYFVIFLLIRGFWLDQSFLSFRTTNNAPEGGFVLGPIAAVIVSLVAAGIAFFDQYLVSRLAEKMHPSPPPVFERVPEAEND